MITCFHDSQLEQYRNPTGALAAGSCVTLSIRVKSDGTEPFGANRDIPSCTLHLWLNEKGGKQLPMECVEAENGSYLFSTSAVISEAPDLCWYFFIIDDGTGRWYYGNQQHGLGGEGCLYSHEPPAFQITVYEPAAVPAWYKNTIVYQIFPDRFARSSEWLERQQLAFRGDDWKGPRRVIQQNWNDTPYYTKDDQGNITRWPFFGGTLQGIRDKLFYLKSMGIGAIYLNPIFTAVSNHKYDTADYMEIDPSFGTMDDFRMLAHDARRIGIRLILDGVFNHTGADSVYFNKFGNYPDAGACQGPSSPYYSWYRFKEFLHEYECWWGVKDLPDMEEADPSYQKFIYGGDYSVIRKWLRAGASGWRLDVADELPDEFISGIRHALKETEPDGLLLGEVWEDASNKISYGRQRRYLLGDELDSTMNYPVRELLTDFVLGKGAAKDAVRKLRSLAENYPPENFYGALNLIGSHDRMRILTLLGDPPQDLSETEKENYRLPDDKLSLAKKRLKMLSLFQYTLPGVPCLYYGDEAGMQGFEDPFNRGTYPWGKEDRELLEHYRMLAALRGQYRSLITGDHTFEADGDNVLICHRSITWDIDADGTPEAASGAISGAVSHETPGVPGHETVISVINRRISDGEDIMVALPSGTKYALDLLSSEELSIEEETVTIHVPAVSAKLIYCTSNPPIRLELPRSAGILCHISSLSSGKMDPQAEYFVDFLAEAGQKLWQILPLNPVDPLSGSPYSSPAVFAGNMEFITGLLADIDWSAYDAFRKEEAYWLEDFALYTIIKEHFNDAPWQQWPEAERNRENLEMWREDKKDAIEIIMHRQFAFHARWQQIKEYANERGISIIGDIPVYVAADSADTWAHREAFILDSEGYPLVGAGVPPDYFSEDGQHWGNPLYNWEYLKAHGYEWWVERVRKAMKDYDYIRLDHFRSFATFFAVPADGKPRDGWWMPGIGKDFFDFLTAKLGSVPFLAEDLGILDAPVYDLLKLTGYPGMLVYQFSSEEMADMSRDEASRKVFYSGTHDNQTLVSWCENTSFEKTPDEIMQELYESSSPWVITPLQDMLGLDDESRMNVPGKAEGNWNWRLKTAMLTPEIAARFRSMAIDTQRFTEPEEISPEDPPVR